MWPVVNAWAMEQDQYFQIVKEFPECTGKVLVVLVARLVVVLRCCVVVFGCLVARLLALLIWQAGILASMVFVGLLAAFARAGGLVVSEFTHWLYFVL
jgi:hypothetical protein